MARKSNTFLMLLCLLVASLLLITGGCDKGNGKSDPSNGDSPTVTTAKTDETTEPTLPEDTASTPASDPASPTDTTSTSKSNPTSTAPPTPPLTPAERAKKEAETERLEHFINLDDCIHGNWRSSSDYGIREKELFNKDGEKIGLVLHHNDVNDQAELETYIVYCGFNEEGQEIDRHFYGNGYRYKTIIRYYEAGRYGWVLHETRYYDSFGWLWMTENVGIDGHIFYEGVEKRTDDAENPIEGFMTFYQEEFGDDDNRVMIFKSYQYDDDGDFITGYLYDSRVDDPEGKIISKAPSENSWRQHWLDTYEECHR
ncbi:MAG: hypothetical protein WBL60_01900 [Saccharofermentanales bacterium]